MKKPIIICIDDDEQVLNSLKEHIKFIFGNNALIELAESGEYALELLTRMLEDDEQDIRMVISDHLMPGIKGDEVLVRFHIASPKTRKIMLTGQADATAVGNAVNNANLYRFIAKPWDLEDFKLTLKEAWKSYDQEQYIEKQNRDLLDMNRQIMELNRSLEEKVIARTEELEETKKNELLALSLNLVKKNEVLSSIKTLIESLENHKNEDEGALLFIKLNHILNFNIDFNQSWNIFQQQFTSCHPSFMRKLMEFFPELSITEKRVCALLRIYMSSKDIASLLNLSIRTVEDHRNNIRKKLNLTSKENLSEFLSKL